ncbi:MAG: signal peptidase II [Thermodesulfovibrio sp.]|nr:signal peptidase II [Thermodesulfovibrio sp.]MDW7971835.1 signal peptidase II [Thermodesulfovibrio sp.]
MSLNLTKTFLLVCSIIFIDQSTKYLAVKFLAPDGTINLLPFLNLVYVENKGSAFGMFKFLGSEFFIFIAIIVTFFLIYMYLKDSKNWFIYSIIFAGALGNTIDRVVYGHVVDFIDLYIGKFHWPAFNVADSAITVGLILFLYKSLKK